MLPFQLFCCQNISKSSIWTNNSRIIQLHPSPYRHINPQTSSWSAYLATWTPLYDSCPLLEILFRLTKPGDAGSPVLLPLLLLFFPSTTTRLSVKKGLNSSVNSLALLPLEQSLGLVHPGGGGGGRRRARAIHLLWRSSRHSSVRGAPAGSQSDGDPDAPLFALRAEMNENTKTMAEPNMRTP